MPDPRPSPTPGQGSVSEIVGYMRDSIAELQQEAFAGHGQVNVEWVAVRLNRWANGLESLASRPLPAAALSEKLDEMALHDDTGDPLDVGYMNAISELRDWLASGAEQ